MCSTLNDKKIMRARTIVYDTNSQRLQSVDNSQEESSSRTNSKTSPLRLKDSNDQGTIVLDRHKAYGENPNKRSNRAKPSISRRNTAKTHDKMCPRLRIGARYAQSWLFRSSLTNSWIGTAKCEANERSTLLYKRDSTSFHHFHTLFHLFHTPT